MMRSMYSCVSGLKNHQTRMDVIGNNIANVNTIGFKKSRAVFKDTFYQELKGSSQPGDGRGGINPMGVGLGTTLGSVDQIHSPAPATITNKSTDLSIAGNGYFILANGEEKFYTRAGAFDFDKEGKLITAADGLWVQGWVADEKGKIDTTDASQGIDISNYRTLKPHATENIEFSGNLNSETEIKTFPGANPGDPSVPIDPTATGPIQYPVDSEKTVVIPKEIYDSLGNKKNVYFRFFKTGIDNSDPANPKSNWACDISMDPAFEDAADYDPATTATDFAVLDLSAAGSSASLLGSGNPKIVRAYNLQFGNDGQFLNPENMNLTLNIDKSAEGAEKISTLLDLSKLNQFEAESTAWAESQDGYAAGEIKSFSFGVDGTLAIVYDNNETRNVARVALANFQNPGGLIQAGNSMFKVSKNSGDARIGAPGGEGMGRILPKSLEMSNVDLSEEFTEMIVTQRGFQANSRIINTSDEMIQELVNLKR